MEQDTPPARETPLSQLRRLQFIDFRLQWEGELNRIDLQGHFRMSTPQASLDIAAYTKAAPNNLTYDRSTKSYVATDAFKPVFESSGAGQYLTQLFALNVGIVAPQDSPLGFHPPVATVPLPNRVARDDVLRWVVRAIAQRETLDVDYQSITREEARRRLVTPHALAQDGMRWHVRAYCHVRNGYRDFVIGRILAVHGMRASNDDLGLDDEWEKLVTVVLAPHPELPVALQKGVEIDFNMKRGQVTIECRQAMLYYLFKALGLSAKGKPLPGVRQVIVQNLEELAGFLPKLGQP
ncbi:WYL domain-containing protein [Variovorax paradoxus]|uniref:WYL domain-containing protein n=1 Tax=Variovorax paradoxus TaxID=34073 RepID=UPI003D645E10